MSSTLSYSLRLLVKASYCVDLNRSLLRFLSPTDVLSPVMSSLSDMIIYLNAKWFLLGLEALIFIWWVRLRLLFPKTALFFLRRSRMFWDLAWLMDLSRENYSTIASLSASEISLLFKLTSLGLNSLLYASLIALIVKIADFHFNI